jgi:hypothetical protein
MFVTTFRVKALENSKFNKPVYIATTGIYCIAGTLQSKYRYRSRWSSDYRACS